jgi:hypothetical protein
MGEHGGTAERILRATARVNANGNERNASRLGG